MPKGPACEVRCRVTSIMENKVVIRIGEKKRVLVSDETTINQIGSPPCTKKLCIRDDIILGMIPE